MSSRKRVVAVVAAVLMTSAAVAGAIYLRASNAADPQPRQPAVTVMVAMPIQADVNTWEEFSGRLEAVERVDIRSRVAGAVQRIHFTEGALVRAGDLLFTIDPAPYATEVARAEAQAVAARARVTYASSEWDRAQRLWDERAIAKRELDERTHARDEAEANLRAAQAGLAGAHLNLGYTQVRAPVSGRVGRIEVTVGNLVPAGPGAPVLTTLVSVNPIYASFDVDEHVVTRALEELPQEKGGRGRLDRIPVRMSTAGSGGEPHQGKLQLIDNQISPRSGTVRVRAVFDNASGRLIPGQFAQVRLGRIKPTPAVLINERAVGTDQSKRFVYVVDDDNRVAYREITLGAASDGLRIVTSGLQPNERVVVNGVQRVRPGVVVEPKKVDMTLLQAAAG